MFQRKPLEAYCSFFSLSLFEGYVARLVQCIHEFTYSICSHLPCCHYRSGQALPLKYRVYRIASRNLLQTKIMLDIEVASAIRGATMYRAALDGSGPRRCSGSPECAVQLVGAMNSLAQVDTASHHSPVVKDPVLSSRSANKRGLFCH